MIKVIRGGWRDMTVLFNVCWFPQTQDRTSWPVNDLAMEIGITPALLRRKVVLWVNHGVLKEAQTSVESDMLYHLVEEPIVGNGFSKGHMGKSNIANTEERMLQDLATHESLVLGMLPDFHKMI